VYGFAGLTLADDVRAAMVQWAADNQRGSRGAHRYTAEEYGLDPVAIEEAFAPYSSASARSAAAPADVGLRGRDRGGAPR